MSDRLAPAISSFPTGSQRGDWNQGRGLGYPELLRHVDQEYGAELQMRSNHSRYRRRDFISRRPLEYLVQDRSHARWQLVRLAQELHE